jgi:hypothetical protein
MTGRSARRVMTGTARTAPRPAPRPPGGRPWMERVDRFPWRHRATRAHGASVWRASSWRHSLTRRHGLARPRRFPRPARTTRRCRAARGGGFARGAGFARRGGFARRYAAARGHRLARRYTAAWGHRLARRHGLTGSRRLVGSDAIAWRPGRQLAVALTVRDAAGTRGVHSRLTGRPWWLSSGTAWRRPVIAPPAARYTRCPGRRGRLASARRGARAWYPYGCRASCAPPGSRASPGA